MLEAVSLAEFKSQSLEIKEVGTVTEVKKAVVSVVGLPTCLYAQMVNFPNNMVGMVVGYDEKKVSILVFGDVINIKAGDQVVGKAEPFELPVGNGFVGRVVNSMSVPLDGKGKIEADDTYPVFRVAPGNLTCETESSKSFRS